MVRPAGGKHQLLFAGCDFNRKYSPAKKKIIEDFKTVDVVINNAGGL
jgi:NADP-dependent 3-hydroxy acid dehydrogenase YdfG